MSTTVNGVSIVELQPEVIRDPRGTSALVRRWRGLRANVDALAASVDGFLPYSIAQEGDGPVATISITYAGGADPNPDDPIEIQFIPRGAVSQAPLAEFPRYATAIAGLTESNKSLLNQIVNGQADYTVTWADPDVAEYTEKRLSGIDSYFRPSFSFNYQARYPATTSFYPSLATTGLVYTKAQIVSALAVPSDVASKMPSALSYLAESVEYEAGADGSRVLSMSFLYGSWDPDLYESA
jgi:hypothetical protein